MAKVRPGLPAAESAAVKLRKSRPAKQKFSLARAIEEICEQTEFSPAEALIKAYNEADEVAAVSDVSPFDALKLKVDIAKTITHKLYANRQESKTEVSGPGGSAIPVGIKVIFGDD